MRSGTFFRHKSLTRNWPGGRRNATTIQEQGEEKLHSVPVWNTRIAGFKAVYIDEVRQPYLMPEPKPELDGGMACIDSNTPDTSSPTQN